MCNASIAASVPSSSATKRFQPFSISRGTRARNFASRKLLASSSPVETQLFIQTRATSSYSSARAGRMVGVGMAGSPVLESDDIYRIGEEKEKASVVSDGLCRWAEVVKWRVQD